MKKNREVELLTDLSEDEILAGLEDGSLEFSGCDRHGREVYKKIRGVPKTAESEIAAGNFPPIRFTGGAVSIRP